MLSWLKNKPHQANKSSEIERAERARMMEALSDDLLGQIRGGGSIKEACHPVPKN